MLCSQKPTTLVVGYIGAHHGDFVLFDPFTLPTSRYGFTNFGSYAFFEHLNSTVKQADIFVMNTNGGRLRLIREGDWMDVGMASSGESGTFSVDWYGPPSQGIALAVSLRERYHTVCSVETLT